MVEERPMAEALYRLAILESQPLRTPEALLEWSKLRQWVLSDPIRLRKYREQKFFSQAEEDTKVQYAPKNPNSLFRRFWNCLFPKK